jgi:hypothetical protein
VQPIACDARRRPRRGGHERDNQNQARGADQLITNAIDAHVQGEQRKDDGDDDGSAGILVPAG